MDAKIIQDVHTRIEHNKSEIRKLSIKQKEFLFLMKKTVEDFALKLELLQDQINKLKP